jgi:hypothetical protein
MSNSLLKFYSHTIIHVQIPVSYMTTEEVFTEAKKGAYHTPAPAVSQETNMPAGRMETIPAIHHLEEDQERKTVPIVQQRCHGQQRRLAY